MTSEMGDVFRVYDAGDKPRAFLMAFTTLQYAKDSWKLSFSKLPGMVTFLATSPRITEVYHAGKLVGTIEKRPHFVVHDNVEHL